MGDHDLWVERGFCDAIFTGDEDDEHWCRMPSGHDHLDEAIADDDYAFHVAPWEYAFPKQETMVRWKGDDDNTTDVKYVVWRPDPPSNLIAEEPLG